MPPPAEAAPLDDDVRLGRREGPSPQKPLLTDMAKTKKGITITLK